MNKYFVLLSLVLMISISFAQVLDIYYFYGETCPHCSKVKPTLDTLEQKYEGEIVIHRYEVYKNSDNQALFKEFLKTHNKTSSGVPALFVSDEFLIGSKQIPDSLESIIIANIESDENTVVPNEEIIIVNEIKESDDTIVGYWAFIQNPFVLLIIIIILIVIAYEIYTVSNKSKTMNSKTVINKKTVKKKPATKKKVNKKKTITRKKAVKKKPTKRKTKK